MAKSRIQVSVKWTATLVLTIGRDGLLRSGFAAGADDAQLVKGDCGLTLLLFF